MPRVGQQQFPYTKRGMADAQKYSQMTGIPLTQEPGQGAQGGGMGQGHQGGYGGMRRPPQGMRPNPRAMGGRGRPGSGMPGRGMPGRGAPLQGLRNLVGGRGNPQVQGLRQLLGGGGMPQRGMPQRGMPGRGMPQGGMPGRGMPQGGMPGGGAQNPLAAISAALQSMPPGLLQKVDLGKIAFNQGRRNYGRVVGEEGSY